jgi:U3 small nucleolar ribonucleoprotein component
MVGVTMRTALINKISEDILKNNDNLEDIKKEVKIYSKLFDDCFRNVYELVTMDDKCPLFVLLYMLENGKDDIGMNDYEFDELVNTLKSAFYTKFNINFDDIKTR